MIKSLLSILIIVLPFIMPQDATIVPDIDTEVINDRVTAKAVVSNKDSEKVSGTFTFNVKKAGRSTSNSKQAGDFVLDPNEKMVLSKSSINLQDGDTLYFHLNIKVGDKEYNSRKVTITSDQKSR